MHLRDGDVNDLPTSSVLDIIDRWSEAVQQGGGLHHMTDEVIECGQGHVWVVEAPTLRTLDDRRIYIKYLKTRPQQPISMSFKYDFSSRETRRDADLKLPWWRHLRA